MEMRNPEIENRNIKLKYVRFFFTKCEICKKEYKQINMWFFNHLLKSNDSYKKGCVCSYCIDKYDDLLVYIYNHAKKPKVHPYSSKQKNHIAGSTLSGSVRTY